MTKGMKRIAAAFLAMGLLIGIGVTAYPIVSASYSEKVRSEIHTEYEEVMQVLDTAVLEEAKEKAEVYNDGFFHGEIDPLTPKENGYYDFLNVAGNGIMGYVHIPKIHVNLPIYHGIGEDALSRGAGHLPQSSLPVGGANTHAVISAHSGMAASPMFSDLPLLKEGDTFTLEILGESLTYEVDKIQTVLPVDIESIRIESGEDLCTLVTCTPYGINTHRLLVRGHRIETPQETVIQMDMVEPLELEQASIWREEYYRSLIKGTILGGIVVTVVLCAVVVIRRKLDA